MSDKLIESMIKIRKANDCIWKHILFIEPNPDYLKNNYLTNNQVKYSEKNRDLC